MIGGEQMRTWTSAAPALRMSIRSCFSVVPRTRESSTTTTRLPFSRPSTVLNLTRARNSR